MPKDWEQLDGCLKSNQTAIHGFYNLAGIARFASDTPKPEMLERLAEALPYIEENSNNATSKTFYQWIDGIVLICNSSQASAATINTFLLHTAALIGRQDAIPLDGDAISKGFDRLQRLERVCDAGILPGLEKMFSALTAHIEKATARSDWLPVHEYRTAMRALSLFQKQKRILEVECRKAAHALSPHIWNDLDWHLSSRKIKIGFSELVENWGQEGVSPPPFYILEKVKAALPEIIRSSPSEIKSSTVGLWMTALMNVMEEFGSKHPELSNALMLHTSNLIYPRDDGNTSPPKLSSKAISKGFRALEYVELSSITESSIRDMVKALAAHLHKAQENNDGMSPSDISYAMCGLQNLTNTKILDPALSSALEGFALHLDRAYESDNVLKEEEFYGVFTGLISNKENSSTQIENSLRMVLIATGLHLAAAAERREWLKPETVQHAESALQKMSDSGLDTSRQSVLQLLQIHSASGDERASG